MGELPDAGARPPRNAKRAEPEASRDGSRRGAGRAEPEVSNDGSRSRRGARRAEPEVSNDGSRSRRGARRAELELSKRLRDAIVDAARAQTIAVGWDGVRMGGVAQAAGVSRQTVYNEFGSKAGLAEALARREVDRFVGEVRAALDAHGADVRAGAYAAIRHTLAAAADNPLVKAILTSARGGSDELLPYLTTRSELVLAESSAALLEWADRHLPEGARATRAFAADTIVRLVVSHIVLPRSPVDETADQLATLALHLFHSAATRPAG